MTYTCSMRSSFRVLRRQLSPMRPTSWSSTLLVTLRRAYRKATGKLTLLPGTSASELNGVNTTDLFNDYFA